MIAGIYNFTIDQGATFTRHITIKNSDETPYVLTNYTARMHIRREITDANILINLTTENGGLTINETAGTIDIYISDEVTSTLTRDGVYDLEIASSFGEVFRVIQGVVRLNLEVTR